MKKYFLILSFVFCILIFFGTSCKEPCPEIKGKTVTGHGKDCVYTDIPGYVDVKVEVNPGKPGTSLAEQLGEIERLASQGQIVGVNLTANMATDTTNYPTYRDFGTLQKAYPNNIIVLYNGNAVVPAAKGQVLPHAEWSAWNKLKLGVNTGGAKNIIKWQIPLSDIGLYMGDGVDKSLYEVILQVNSVSDLDNNMPALTQAVNAGFEVKVIPLSNLNTNQNQKPIWNSFGALQKAFPGQLTVEWGNFSLCPNNASQNALTYADAVKWNYQKFGANAQGHKWSIPSNEWPLFQALGYTQDVFIMGSATTQVTVEFGNDIELREAPAVANLYATVYPTVNLKVTGNINAPNGPNMTALNALTVGPNSNKFQFVNGTGQIIVGSDSTHLNYATTAYKLGQVNALAATTHAGGKNFYLAHVSGKDSMPANQVFLVPEANSNNMNLAREIPKKIKGVHNLNAQTLMSGPIMQYNGKMEWAPTINPETGYEYNFTNVNSAFLDRYECQTPNIPAKPGTNGPIIWSKTAAVMGNYYNNPPYTATDGLNVTAVNFETDNNSGKKMQASFDKVHGHTGYIPWVQKTSYTHVELNVNPAEEKFKDGGKTIIDFIWLDKQRMANNVNGTGSGPGTESKIIVKNCKIYLGDPTIKANYDYWAQLAGPQAFWDLYRIQLDNSEAIFTMPAGGKQAYSWNSNTGKSSTSQPPKTAAATKAVSKMDGGSW